MPNVRLKSGAEFESSSNTSILDAAAKSNIVLPYSCKTGRCSTCKFRVLNGTTHALHPEIGLSEKDKAEGWVLGCVRAANSDLLIEVDHLEDVALPSVKTLPCKIRRIERRARDVIQVNLRFPPAADFIFIPGQYIEIIGPGGLRRSYSIASTDFAKKDLELYIRAVPGGVMSDYWFNHAKDGDLLRINGPLGTFFLREIAGKDLVFLATGTGIAPIKSMLDSLTVRERQLLPRSMTLLWGGRRIDDLYLAADELPDSVDFIPVLSRPDEGWLGAKGYVQDVFLDKNPSLTNSTVYACGSGAMIHAAKDLLVSAGLSGKEFHSEFFTTSGEISVG